MTSIAALIAQELNVRVPQVDAAVALLDDKSTVPFIARYRKEATGGLDDTQLRTLEERLAYLRDLDERRGAILKSIDEQGKLTPDLATAIGEADHQGAARRSLSALQAEAADQGADRARGRTRAAGARPAAGSVAGPCRRGRALRRRGARGRRHRGGARRRALDPDGDLRRRRRAGRRLPDAGLGARRMEIDGRPRQGSRGREVLGLLRRHRAGEGRAVAPRAGAAARPQGGLPAPGRGPARRGRGRADRTGAPHRGARRHREPGPAGRQVADRHGAPGPGRSSCCCTSRSRPSSGCASRPKSRPSACSAATCTTCCWPRRPASA